jgi:iron complex outermembrane recepter protein
VHIDQSARGNEIYIRGIGSGYNQSFDQSVGMFIDDIYHGRSRTSSSTFLDLDSVEILKGPQSTFFGNNAIAGAFNIITKKPSDTFDASARALYGQFGQYAVEVGVGGPVSDKLDVRVAAVADGQTGWLRNITGEKEPKQDNLAGRLSFLFKPTPDFDADLKLEASSNRQQGGLQLQLDNCPPPTPFGAAGFCAASLAVHAPVGVGINEIAQNGGQYINLDTREGVLTMNWRHWGQTFTSVTATPTTTTTGASISTPGPPKGSASTCRRSTISSARSSASPRRWARRSST